MSAIDDTFTRLRADGRKALLPFITAGDPDLEFTADCLRTLAKQGAAICEVGIPYSDPIADGPVIQASYTRALDRGTPLADILGTVGRVAPELSTPLVSMVSYAIVFRREPQRYIDQALAAGFAGAIIPDLPVEEAESLSRVCRQSDFSLIQLVTPTTPRERAKRIAGSSTGFVYCVSITGITGERQQIPSQLIDNVGWLRAQTDLPLCIGFGVSTPEHVRTLAPVADGLIVGSAIVRRIAAAATEPREKVLADVGQFVGQLAAALSPDA